MERYNDLYQPRNLVIYINFLFVDHSGGDAIFGNTSAFYGTYVSSSRSGSLGVEKSLEHYKRNQS
jgi:hypothetical protein